MQVAAINRRAQARYSAFVTSMDVLADLFDELDKIIDRVDDTKASGGFTLATQDELKAYRLKAFGELDRLRTTAKKHEAELVSRDWRF
jgi:glutamine synthetase type III